MLFLTSVCVVSTTVLLGALCAPTESAEERGESLRTRPKLPETDSQVGGSPTCRTPYVRPDRLLPHTYTHDYHLHDYARARNPPRTHSAEAPKPEALGKTHGTGSEMIDGTEGTQRHFLSAKSTRREGSSDGFESEGTYSNHTLAARPRFHA